MPKLWDSHSNAAELLPGRVYVARKRTRERTKSDVGHTQGTIIVDADGNGCIRDGARGRAGTEHTSLSGFRNARLFDPRAFERWYMRAVRAATQLADERRVQENHAREEGLHKRKPTLRTSRTGGHTRRRT